MSTIVLEQIEESEELQPPETTPEPNEVEQEIVPVTGEIVPAPKKDSNFLFNALTSVSWGEGESGKGECDLTTWAGSQRQKTMFFYICVYVSKKH